jgi:Plasmid pRiA4b ORF-3-like protein
MLEAAAGKAELISQIRSLLAWVGPGRKLTQTGRIGLADARHLVEILGTGDTIDPEIGDRVFKTRSSEDLAHLNRIVEWAKAARLVRVSGTKLMAVKKNAALAERPLDLVLVLLEAYPRLGKPLFPRNAWRQSLVGDEFTDVSQELTTALLRSAGPCPLDKLSDTAYDAIEARYMLTDLTSLQRDSLRRTITVDVTIAMAALHILGVVVLDREADSAGLTDLGRYAIRRFLGMAQPGDPVLQVRITLAGVYGPPVWRQVVIPAGYTLDRVHGVIQAAMGWQNSHLHMFRIAGREYGPAYLDDELETLNEKQFRIGDLVKTGDLAGSRGSCGAVRRPAARAWRRTLPGSSDPAPWHPIVATGAGVPAEVRYRRPAHYYQIGCPPSLWNPCNCPVRTPTAADELGRPRMSIAQPAHAV